MKVFLSNRGNPDLCQYPNRPLPGSPKDKWAPVPSIRFAAHICRAYIWKYALGSGNWTGGAVVQTGGNVKGIAVLGTISYNGRFFPIDEPHGYGKPNRIAARAIEKLSKSIQSKSTK